MTILCLQGSSALGFKKGKVYPVLSLTELGREYGDRVAVKIQLTDRTITLYARHRNRLKDMTGCYLNNGNPLKNIRVELRV